MFLYSTVDNNSVMSSRQGIFKSAKKFKQELQNINIKLYEAMKLVRTSNPKKVVEAGPPPKDWEDEYHRLKSRFDELKVDYNDKEQHNKLYAMIHSYIPTACTSLITS